MTGSVNGLHALGSTLLTHRVMKHGRLAATSAGASALAALVLLVGMWASVPHHWLLTWLPFLAGALVVRLAVARAQRLSPQSAVRA